MTLRRNTSLGESSRVSLSTSKTRFLFIIYFLYTNTHCIFYRSICSWIPKAGLPHVHILLIIAQDDKLVYPEDVDRLISAKIPDQPTDPLAYDILTTFMVSGPCVTCSIDRKCSNLYPKWFCNQTTFDEHGFALYRQRRNLQPVIVNGREINNQ